MTLNPQYVLAGTTSNFRFNLAATLVRTGFDVAVLISMDNSVSKAQGLKKVVQIRGYSEEDFIHHLEQNEDLLDDLQGTFLWTTDSIMRLIVHSNLKVETKTRILPTDQQRYWKILGSKSGQIEMFREFEIPHPKTHIVQLGERLPDLQSWNRVLVKGDQFGGGFYVREFDELDEVQLSAQIPANWYPIVIQEKIKGNRIAVEAFYHRGEFIAYLHSDTFVGHNEFAPSVSRAYQPLQAENIKSDLIKLGRSLNLSGMVNVSYIHESNSNEHYLFEFDPRPTAWHHMFEHFNLPLRAAIKDEVSIPLYPRLEKSHNLYEPARLLTESLESMKIGQAISVLRKRKINGYGIPMPSNFYSKQALMKNWIKLFLFPLIPARKQVGKFKKHLREHLPSKLINTIKRKKFARSLSELFPG